MGRKEDDITIDFSNDRNGIVTTPDGTASWADLIDIKANNVGGICHYRGFNKLPPMRYKSFEWKHNPHSCSWSCTKSVIKHKYPELACSELEDLDTDGAIISGEGEFFGEDAYDRWMELVSVFNEHGPGEFFHPIYKDVKYAILQKLDSKLEPRQNYVSYSFEFWQHSEPDIKIRKLPKPVRPTPPPGAKSSGGSGTTYGIIRHGCRCSWVKQLQQKMVDSGIRLPKYGVDGIFKSETEAGVRAYQKKYKLKIDGQAGAQTLHHMGIGYHGNSSCGRNKVMRWGGGGTPSSSKVYVVRSGDTLRKLAQRYYSNGNRWSKIAKANHLKNPNMIYVGQKLTIP